MLFGLFKKKKNVAIEEATEPVAKEQESIARTELGKQVLERLKDSDGPIFLARKGENCNCDFYVLKKSGYYGDTFYTQEIKCPRYDVTKKDKTDVINSICRLELYHYNTYTCANSRCIYDNRFSTFEIRYTDYTIVSADDVYSHFVNLQKEAKRKFNWLKVKGVYSFDGLGIKDKGFYIIIHRKLKIDGSYYIEYNESDYSQRFDNEINMCSIYDDVFINIVEAKEFISYNNNRKKK